VPGHVLCRYLKGIGKVYLHAVVDTFGSYAFGVLHVSKQPEAAVAVLHNDVLPFYRDLDLPIGAVLTDNGREFCGTDSTTTTASVRISATATRAAGPGTRSNSSSVKKVIASCAKVRGPGHPEAGGALRFLT
jgi:transposase InsO family protein